MADRVLVQPSVSSDVVPEPLPIGEKPPGYFRNTRSDAIAKLPQPVGRVLDVGCGEGAAAEPLLGAGATEIWGIEIEPAAAAVAGQRYDQVITGPAEQAVGELEGQFNTVLCYDILEHLVDPASVLDALHSVAAPDSYLHVSLPNARHYSLARDLILRGSFAYTEYGHRDSTHLRWFTLKDITALCERCGWQVRSTARPQYPRRWRWLNVAGQLGAEFLSYQWWVLAQRDGSHRPSTD